MKSKRSNASAADDKKRKSVHAKPSTLVETPKGKRILIGVAERVDLPDWGVVGLKAKIDTGARSSAVHVDAVEVIDRNHIRFSIPRPSGRMKWVTARFSRRAKVRSSSGEEQTRYFVTTELRLGTLVHDVEISLTSRDAMRYPMLLGRTAMKGLCIDPMRRYVATKLRLDDDDPAANRPKKKTVKKKNGAKKKASTKTSKKTSAKSASTIASPKKKKVKKKKKATSA